jgi:hypothetical protein
MPTLQSCIQFKRNIQRARERENVGKKQVKKMENSEGVFIIFFCFPLHTHTQRRLQQ